MHSGKTRRLAGRLGAVFTGIALAIVGTAGAHAAPPFASDATITSLDFVQTTIASGEHAELTGTWALPDNPTPPAGFVIDLPAGLEGDADEFALVAPDGVTEVGRCTVTATQLICDIDADYITENPVNLSGTFDFWVEVTTEVTEEQEVVYDFGEVSAGITVTPGDDACPECGFDGVVNYKGGTLDPETNTIHWVVGVKAPATGMAGGETVTVVDEPGPGQEIVPGTLVRHANEVGIRSNGEPGPIGWRVKPADSYTVSADGSTVTFTSEAGYFYKVEYTTRITDGGAARTYTNDARVDITGQRSVTVTGEVVRRGGTGTGSGDAVGRFSITKDVIWHSEPIDDLVFEGTYTVTDPQGTEHAGTFKVADGTTWTSTTYPAGSIVHLEEITPTAPESIEWADPVFSTNDFEIPDGTVTAVALTNEATLATGAFAASKELTGSGADLVPADATFVLEYEYAAGPGYPAGSGSLTLPADGTVVTSDELPLGATLTLTERAPAAVEGGTWGAPRLSTDTVVIGVDADVTVTVTNPITAVPPSERPPLLASTGGALVAAPIVAGAVLLIGVGVLAQLRRSRAAR